MMKTNHVLHMKVLASTIIANGHYEAERDGALLLPLINTIDLLKPLTV